jgi:hypothetical protein
MSENTPHINVSSQEGKNNKQLSQNQKTILRHTCVKNMIAARLLSFIGKAVQDPHPLSTYKTNADYMLQQQ